uniref:Fcf2 domain-containing protein n=1 Tax=Syphacia muris TaxID=451379 RepID=A0A0N5ASP1_9BILA
MTTDSNVPDNAGNVDTVLKPESSETTVKDKINEDDKSEYRKTVEREKTKGSDWYNLPATEMTEERARDLEIIQMRDALDTKVHYKKNDRSVLPKYFEVGTVLENKADYYSSRIPKKLRKRTIVEELMADAEFRTKQRKKFEEIKAQQAITRKGAFQHRTYRRRKKHSMKKHH